MRTRKLAVGGFAVGALCAGLFVGGSPAGFALAQERTPAAKECDCSCETHRPKAADRYRLQVNSGGKFMVFDGASGRVYSINGDGMRTFDPLMGTVTVGTLEEIDERGLIKPAPAPRRAKRSVR